MKQFIFLTCLIASAAMIHAEEETTGARLLIAKHILNKYLVEKMDCVIKVAISFIFMIYNTNFCLNLYILN